MIPKTQASNDIVIQAHGTKQDRIDFTNNVISGKVDGVEAVKQWCILALNTERYQYVMHSWSYGIELNDLYGMPVDYVCPELERRITECLKMNDKIEEVDNFVFDTSNPEIVIATFDVKTIYGEFTASKEMKNV